LLSHPSSDINPAARTTIFKCFKQHSMSARACPHHTFSLDGSGRRTAASCPSITGSKRLNHCPMNALEKTPKTGTTPGYVRRSTTLGPALLSALPCLATNHLRICALLPSENYRCSMQPRGWRILKFRRETNCMPFKTTGKGNMQFGLTANTGSVFAGKKGTHITWR
jgi:hypothetical protein